MNTYDRTGKCIQKININGNGVSDNFEGPCVDNMKVTKSKGLLILGELDKTPFVIFSDEPNVLVIVKKDQCNKRIYSTTNGKTTNSVIDMDEDECEEVKEKIKKGLKKKQNKMEGKHTL